MILVGGQFGPAAVEQARQRMAEIREQLKSLVPEYDWDRLLGTGVRNFEQIDSILKDINSKTADGIQHITESGQKVRSLTSEYQQAAIAAGKLTTAQKQAREQLGLAEGESFRAYSAAESAAEKTAIKRLENDVRYWERLVDQFVKAGDSIGANEAAAMAKSTAENLQAVRDAHTAIRNAEKEQLDTARDQLREAKELNREKEQQVKHEQSILKEIQNEQRQYNVSNAAGDTDTRQGITVISFSEVMMVSGVAGRWRMGKDTSHGTESDGAGL